MSTTVKAIDAVAGVYSTPAMLYHPLYKADREKMMVFAKAAIRAMPLFRAMLNIGNDVKIIFKPIKQRGTRGSFYFHSREVHIDPRMFCGIRDMMSTLAHELVHAEQYHEGRLGFDKTGARTWNGVAWHIKGKTHKAYLGLPWEVEARERQEKLAGHVMAQLSLTPKLRPEIQIEVIRSGVAQ